MKGTGCNSCFWFHVIPTRTRIRRTMFIAAAAGAMIMGGGAAGLSPRSERLGDKLSARLGDKLSARPPEAPDDPPASPHVLAQRGVEPARVWVQGPFVSVQVNVDSFGNNFTGDAANEPSMAIDPTNANRIVIGWRQFDTIASNFRQAGVAYSHDGGQTWTFPGVLEPGQFRSDPVLGADPDGGFYYLSLSAVDSMELFKSVDGGVTWSFPPVWAFGGDKEWMAIDRTTGIGRGNIYADWNVQWSCCWPNDFTRSTNGGASFDTLLPIPEPRLKWGTMDVGPDGTLYLAGAALNTSLGHIFARSTDARNPAVTPTFDLVKGVDLGGRTVGGGINPAGLLGQVWIATDHSDGPTRGNVYISGSVWDPGLGVLDIKFIRSVDGGDTWNSPVFVNDDAGSGAWHWFGTMSVAPNGRIDVIWNDTRNDAGNFFSQVFYSFSLDAGLTWSTNIAVTIPFDPSLGWPQQNKLGDYYHMLSDNGGASLAYAATFNGEQDVYFLRIPRDCDGNGIEDDCDITCGATGTRCDVFGCGTRSDCNGNDIPDNCEPDEDCQPNGVRDICDIGAETSNDCNGNRVPDDCEPNDDCNSNTVQDICDLAEGTSKDCNGNGVPDECDIVGPTSNDVNGDGVPDECQGACCTCDGCFDTTVVDCSVREGDFSGLGVTCIDPAACTPLPAFANDDCLQKDFLPSVSHQTIPIDNRCATLDGPPSVACPADQPFGSDLWFNFFPPCSGEMTVSLCDNTDFDAILAVYGGGPICQCPTDNSSLIECGDDTCGVGGGPPVVTIPVVGGNCYTIRVAGWSGSTGLGQMEISVPCECFLASPPITPTVVDEVTLSAGQNTATAGGSLKNRFISVTGGDPGRNQALRVKVVSLPATHDVWNGIELWVDNVFEVCENAGGVNTPCVPEPNLAKKTFWAATLSCDWNDALFMDWTTLDLPVHIYNEVIIPSNRAEGKDEDAVYEVAFVDVSCALKDNASYSNPPLTVIQPRWGDVLDACNKDPCGAPQGVTNIGDVTGILEKFQNLPGAPIKSRADLVGLPGNEGELDRVISIVDVTWDLDAFIGGKYEFAITDPCDGR